MRHSFQTDIETPDIRPALLSLAALMLLLIPILLLIVNPQKTTSLPLSMSSSSGIPPIAHTGPIETLKLSIDINKESDGTNQEKGFSMETSYALYIEASIRRSDIRASQGDTELKIWNFSSVRECMKKLRDLKSIDKSRERITILPSKKLNTRDIVYWIDILRSDDLGTLFPSVVLQSSQHIAPILPSEDQ